MPTPPRITVSDSLSIVQAIASRAARHRDRVDRWLVARGAQQRGQRGFHSLRVAVGEAGEQPGEDPGDDDRGGEKGKLADRYAGQHGDLRERERIQAAAI